MTDVDKTKEAPLGFPACYHCGTELTWRGDYDFEDLGIDCKGTVYTYACPNCGAEIECYVPEDKDWGEGDGS